MITAKPLQIYVFRDFAKVHVPTVLSIVYGKGVRLIFHSVLDNPSC